MISCSLQGETVPSVPLNTIWWHQVSWSGLDVVYADRALASASAVEGSQGHNRVFDCGHLCASHECVSYLERLTHQWGWFLKAIKTEIHDMSLRAALGCLMHNVLLCSCCSTLAQEKSTGTIVYLIWFDLTITIIQGLSSHFTFLIKIAKLLLYLF